MSSLSSPCAACKCQRRKCTQECVFAPYFPADQPQKFAYVHEVFGASNVAKLLNELHVSQREDAANSLAYEAEVRLRDPVYGCVGLISILQHKLNLLHKELSNAKKELAAYIGPQPMIPTITQPTGANFATGNPLSSMMALYNTAPGMTIGGEGDTLWHGGGSTMLKQQQLFEEHQLAAIAAAREQQDMVRAHEQQQFRRHHDQQQQQYQQEIKYDANGSNGVGKFVSAMDYNTTISTTRPWPDPPALALGSFASPYHIQAHRLSPQLEQARITKHQEQAQEQRSGGVDCRNDDFSLSC
ncbi:protein LATERAL ORGAN BOUNDARIES-like [Rhodamnia argentea]|uniref:Protein LATERAL ORGAN BOUNDARIES-like n=1 Tax=Rhodamnia argentea TaxID=178133 RepID=A0ABM3HJ15_9MYRT|nr:protein LATERAL ORGAN BOUNDARIES-like [Rhodamnia argentea]